jgi:starvation-inducible DNA-binding protein
VYKADILMVDLEGRVVCGNSLTALASKGGLLRGELHGIT